MRWAALIVIVAACGDTPARPTVTGTLICQPQTAVLGVNGAVPDDQATTVALEQQVVEQITSERFLFRVAAEEHVEQATLAHAVTARPVKDSRLVEIGVALPDRAVAQRVCNAILDDYMVARMTGDDRLAAPHEDVRIVDHCAPPRAPR